MDLQNKDYSAYDDVNLYDYLKVIAKRKTLIIGLFLASVLASAVISLSMPKIYIGERLC